MKSKNLNFKCFRCKKQIKEPGAILFSPPTVLLDDGIPIDQCNKFHICNSCYKDILYYFSIHK